MKVKEIIFEDGKEAPTFILENGDIKRPFFVYYGNKTSYVWLNEKEKQEKVDFINEHGIK